MSRKHWAFVGSITTLAVGVRAIALLSTPEPLGTDGYYVVQVERWVAEGRFHVPDGSWVLRWLSAYANVAGAERNATLASSGLASRSALLAFPSTSTARGIADRAGSIPRP